MIVKEEANTYSERSLEQRLSSTDILLTLQEITME